MAVFNLNFVFLHSLQSSPSNSPSIYPRTPSWRLGTPQTAPWDSVFWGYITLGSPAPTCRHWGLSHTGCILCLEINLIKPHPPTLDPGSPHSEGRRQQQGWGGRGGRGGHCLVGVALPAALGWESSLVAIHQPGLGTGSVGCCSSISKTMHMPGAAWPQSLGALMLHPCQGNAPRRMLPLSQAAAPQGYGPSSLLRCSPTPRPMLHPSR